jgi:hypothetical protein
MYLDLRKQKQQEYAGNNITRSYTIGAVFIILER